MKHLVRPCTAMALILVVLAGTQCTYAQGRKNKNDKLESVEVSGKIVNVKRGLITAVDGDNQQGMIKIDPKDTKVYVTGTAMPSVLRSGMFIRFTGKFENAVATEPVTELEIFEPSESVDIGVFPEDPTDPNSDVLVAGRVAAFKRGKLIMATGRQKVQADMAEDAELSLHVSDYSLASPGDDIRVLGKLFAPGKIIATQVDITLAEPLGEPEKKTRGRTSRRGDDEE